MKHIGFFYTIVIILSIVVVYFSVYSNLSKSDSSLRDSTINKYSASSINGIDIQNQYKVISSKYFSQMIETARQHPRKRKMFDLTKDPNSNSMQILINTWITGSYSPVHMHAHYSEAFVVLDGALAFFTFNDDGTNSECHILSALSVQSSRDKSKSYNAAIIVEKGQYHAMTAAPPDLGWPGYSIIFENSGHKYDPVINTKVLANFAPSTDDGLNGDPNYFKSILKLCPQNE